MTSAAIVQAIFDVAARSGAQEGADPRVFIVSDSLGETAELVTKAALSQFAGRAVSLHRFPMITSGNDVDAIVLAATQRPTLIVYTLIVPEVRDAMAALTEQHGVIAIDVMGPMMDGFIQLLGAPPQLRPGLIHQMDAAYFRRIECVEFAVKYDDARDPKGFLRADVVLLGVSRCSKTPVSMYLAHRLCKVANLPLVPEVPLPKEIFQVSRQKMVGFRIDPRTLTGIRIERMRTMGLRRDANYADPGRILAELEWADEVYKKLGCAVIDVSNKAIEETAVRVLEIVTPPPDRGAKSSVSGSFPALEPG